jgi:LuxR family maltose regulon positive regulatory protein
MSETLTHKTLECIISRPASAIPDYPPQYLCRPRLHTQLDAATQRPVTLVSAPAGWGKTVLVSAWARAHETARLFWLTARADDTTPLWRQLLTALATTDTVGTDPTDDVPAETALRRLASTFESLTDPLIIVLDDCDDLLDPDQVTKIEEIVHLSKCRPRLVLICRADPSLPLHRWRTSGELGEVRMDQLAFTVAETADLLARHGVTLPEAAVVGVHALTAGWAAGLRLAALAMRGRPEPESAIAELGIQDPIADYLSAEVLAALPPDLYRVLVAVSVAECLTASLVEALTGRSDGARVLAELHRRGAFVDRCGGSGERGSARRGA